jgi:hypothetical protein
MLFLSSCDVGYRAIPSDQFDDATVSQAYETSTPDAPPFGSEASGILDSTNEDRAVGIADRDMDATVFFRVADLPDGGAGLMASLSAQYLKVSERTVVPPYYGDLARIVFPAALVRGETQEWVGYEVPETVPFDFDGVSDYPSLVSKVRVALPFLDDFVFCPTWGDIYGYPGVDETGPPMTFFDDDAINRRAQSNGAAFPLYFKNSEYGVVVEDSSYRNDVVCVHYLADRNEFEKNVMLVSGTAASTFTPKGDSLLEAMPLGDALLLAEANRTKPSDVRMVQLVYSHMADAWGDEEYHLCWLIDANVPYYVNCETGKVYCPMHSEE